MAFNNVLDPTTLDPTDYSISPAPASPAIGTTPTSDGDFIFGGHYQPATMYTFTFFAGKSVTDFYGVTYTAMEEKKITYTTQPIAITSISPANNGTFTIAAATPTPRVGISFNQSMDPTSLLATEYTFTDSVGTAIPAAVTASGCAPTSTTCQLRVTPTPAMTILRPGTYTFTLKANATIVDVLGNVFTQPTDRTVTFDVANGPAPVICL